jgi:CRP-like cAMP-binding protein
MDDESKHTHTHPTFKKLVKKGHCTFWFGLQNHVSIECGSKELMESEMDISSLKKQLQDQQIVYETKLTQLSRELSAEKEKVAQLELALKTEKKKVASLDATLKQTRIARAAERGRSRATPPKHPKASRSNGVSIRAANVELKQLAESLDFLMHCCIHLSQITIDKGESIFKYGDAATALYLLKQGSADVSIHNPEDVDSQFQTHSQREGCLGEEVLLGGTPLRSYSVCAGNQGCTLMQLTRSSFEGLCRDSAEFAELCRTKSPRQKRKQSFQLFKSYGFLMHASAYTTKIKLPQGDTLMSEGDLADCMYFIVSGILSIIIGGKQIASLNASDVVVGELGLTTHEKVRNATVQAETDCHLLKLSEAEYKQQV